MPQPANALVLVRDMDPIVATVLIDNGLTDDLKEAKRLNVSPAVAATPRLLSQQASALGGVSEKLTRQTKSSMAPYPDLATAVIAVERAHAALGGGASWKAAALRVLNSELDGQTGGAFGVRQGADTNAIDLVRRAKAAVESQRGRSGPTAVTESFLRGLVIEGASALPALPPMTEASRIAPWAEQQAAARGAAAHEIRHAWGERLPDSQPKADVDEIVESIAETACRIVGIVRPEPRLLPLTSVPVRGLT